MAIQTPTTPMHHPNLVDGTRRHILDLDDFSPEEIELVMATTDAMGEVLGREIKKVPTLRGKVIVTLFYEASTRTRVSFEEAGKLLSADVINVSSSGSSVEKGESLLNTVRTLQATGADLIVVRHPHSGAPYFMARNLERTSVINGGDGWHAHPSQALLDLYTIRQHRGSISGAKVVIVGDILHSRVARSNLWGLTAAGAHVVLCAPPTLLPQEFLDGSYREDPDSSGLASVEVTFNVEEAIQDADVVMPLRLQLERQQAGLLPTLREYSKMYQVDERRLKLARPGALVLHPGPMNEGIEISPQVAHGAQSLIEEQVHNGVAVRMALLYLLVANKEGPPSTAQDTPSGELPRRIRFL
ncbi:MAG: aspartate carbamoyltransferase catalytic subunit [Chloroflexi bacterium]|nr:aspartate carbamoyltransferase catalytic subunit [Chloroflexota bacterium]